MPRRKGYEECRKVPTVDCFLVLKTVPDLECSPEAYEDCIDVAKEVRIEKLLENNLVLFSFKVPYFEEEEECFQVPFEVCSLVEEEEGTRSFVCNHNVPSRFQRRSAPSLIPTESRKFSRRRS